MSTAAPETVTLVAVGDLIIDREDPSDVFASAGDVLRRADIALGNLESVYAEVSQRNPAVIAPTRSGEHNLDAVGDAGFDVLTLANNQILGYGYDGFTATLDNVRRRGIVTCGVGMDLAEARQPAVLERGDTTVAILGYSSILPPGFRAEPGRPGVTPLQAHAVFEPAEPEAPGTEPDVLTFADRDDVAAMQDDVRRAREIADVVVVTPHWGVHIVPVVIADYEREIARAAIDAGADIVLGHHAHILKGIDVYRGRVIFHSLNHFVLDAPPHAEAAARSPRLRAFTARYSEHAATDGREDGNPWPGYPFPAEARMTVIAKIAITGGHVGRVSLLPCLIDGTGTPQVLPRSNPAFTGVVAYLRRISAEAGLGATLEVDGDEVVVSA